VPPAWSAEEEVARQHTWQLVCELERQLRGLMEIRYQEKYGKAWLDRVHEVLRERWQKTQEQDAWAFAQYDRPTPGLLDYSYLGDLLTLINGQ